MKVHANLSTQKCIGIISIITSIYKEGCSPTMSQKKVCNGYGPEECRTVYESSCSTRYVEKKPGKFVADTKCKKLPIKGRNSTERVPNCGLLSVICH